MNHHEPTPVISPRLREMMFVVQFLGNIIVLGIIVALLYTASHDIAQTARSQTAANARILDHLQRVFISHAIASTRQNCAISSEIAFLVESSPQAPPKLIKRVNRFVHDACKIEVVPPLGSEHSPGPQPTSSRPTPNPTVSIPSPSGSPHPGPTPSPSPSPSPTIICLPDIGCI